MSKMRQLTYRLDIGRKTRHDSRPWVPTKLQQAVDYVESLVERDISRVDGTLRDAERARRLLRSYARLQGTQSGVQDGGDGYRRIRLPPPGRGAGLSRFLLEGLTTERSVLASEETAFSMGVGAIPRFTIAIRRVPCATLAWTFRFRGGRTCAASPASRIRRNR